VAAGRTRAAPATRDDADLADPGQVAALLERIGPATGVIHAAAWTDVDGAQTRPAAARRDNQVATRVLAEACARRRAPLVVVSTDFVFDGEASRPYRELDGTCPLGVYGRTKLAAERAALEAWPGGTRIVRTQWLFGPGRPGHFVDRILQAARAGRPLRVVDDQVGCPTSTPALAEALWDVLELAPPGIYHAACEGFCSRYELARAVLEIAGLPVDLVRPCSTAEMPRPAPRPAFAPLDCSKLAAVRGRRLPPWRDELIRYLAGGHA